MVQKPVCFKVGNTKTIIITHRPINIRITKKNLKQKVLVCMLYNILLLCVIAEKPLNEKVYKVDDLKIDSVVFNEPKRLLDQTPRGSGWIIRV